MIKLPELPFIDTMMTTIVFYGFERRLSVSEAKDLIESICGLLNETPSHAHVGMGEGKRSRTPKFNMLDKAIAKGDFDNYSYIEAVNYFQKGNVRDCSLAVGIKENPERRVIEIHFRREREKPIDIGAMLQKVLQHLSPNYGVLYDLTVREGPLWFISGIWSSGMPRALGQVSGEFKQEYLFGKKFRDGYFRDVFKWNYLSRAHLDKTIEGVRFQDWIEEPLRKNGWLGKSNTRGTLSPLGNGSAIWEVTLPECSTVRPRMLAAGLLMVKG